MQTYTGRMFWPFDPRVGDIEIYDIAVPLSRMCRFGGHCIEFYSVADHSVWVMERVPGHLGPKVKLAALLHDASEGYLIDVPRPLKGSPEFAPYKRAEKRVLEVIMTRFGVIHEYREWRDLIKGLDMMALATEKRDIVIEGAGTWKGVEGIEPDFEVIVPTSDMVASAARFVSHFTQHMDG